MSLQVTNYPRPNGAPGDTIPAAYLFFIKEHTSFLGTAPAGAMILGVWESAAAYQAGAATLATIACLYGYGGFPTYAQLATNAAAVQQANPSLDPVGAIREAAYQAVMALPRFAGLAVVEVA